MSNVFRFYPPVEARTVRQILKSVVVGPQVSSVDHEDGGGHVTLQFSPRGWEKLRAYLDRQDHSLTPAELVEAALASWFDQTDDRDVLDDIPF